MIFRSQEFCRK